MKKEDQRKCNRKKNENRKVIKGLVITILLKMEEKENKSNKNCFLIFYILLMLAIKSEKK